jgi:hypothetical protein
VLVNDFGSGWGNESKQSAANRHISPNVVKRKLHGALVWKNHEQTPDIELGTYHHEHLVIIPFVSLLGIGAQDAVSGLVLEGIRRKLNPRKDVAQVEPGKQEAKRNTNIVARFEG